MLKRYASTGLAWLWIAVLVIGLDRYTKWMVVKYLIPYDPVPVLPFFNLTLAFNTGAAYSFLHNASGWQNTLLTSLAVIVSACIVYWLSQLSARAYWTVIALTLVLGGALGNAWDRLLYGHVVDFLDFHLGGWHFAIFNIADSAICVGAFMLILEWLFLRYQPDL